MIVEIADAKRDAWIGLVRESFTLRGCSVLICGAMLAPVTRAAIAAGMSEAEIAEATLSGNAGWDVGELLEYVASIREDRNVAVQLFESTLRWMSGDES